MLLLTALLRIILPLDEFSKCNPDVYMHVVHACVCVYCMHVCLCVCVYMHACMHVRVCLYVCNLGVPLEPTSYPNEYIQRCMFDHRKRLQVQPRPTLRNHSLPIISVQFPAATTGKVVTITQVPV